MTLSRAGPGVALPPAELPCCRISELPVSSHGFFDDVPPVLERPGRGSPWDLPTAECPRAAVADALVLARTEKVAVAVTAIWAFRAGFEWPCSATRGLRLRIRQTISPCTSACSSPAQVGWAAFLAKWPRGLASPRAVPP